MGECDECLMMLKKHPNPQLILPASEVNGKAFYWLQKELHASGPIHDFSGTLLHLEFKPRQVLLFWGAQTSAV